VADGVVEEVDGQPLDQVGVAEHGRRVQRGLHVKLLVENELGAYIGRFHLDALTSGVLLNVDLDTTLTVVVGNLYRLLALKLSRYEKATPATLWRDFLDATGTCTSPKTASPAR
jgi:hypothetical protein